MSWIYDKTREICPTCDCDDARCLLHDDDRRRDIERAIRETIGRSIEACESEQLIEDLDNGLDDAYRNGVNDCIAAIRGLLEDP